jgi:hypothetical protein
LDETQRKRASQSRAIKVVEEINLDAPHPRIIDFTVAIFVVQDRKILLIHHRRLDIVAAARRAY